MSFKLGNRGAVDKLLQDCQIQPTTLFGMLHKLGMVFIFLNGRKEIKR